MQWACSCMGQMCCDRATPAAKVQQRAFGLWTLVGGPVAVQERSRPNLLSQGSQVVMVACLCQEAGCWHCCTAACWARMIISCAAVVDSDSRYPLVTTVGWQPAVPTCPVFVCYQQSTSSHQQKAAGVSPVGGYTYVAADIHFVQHVCVQVHALLLLYIPSLGAKTARAVCHYVADGTSGTVVSLEQV